MPLLLYKVLLNLFAQSRQLAEAFMLTHVILQVAAQVHIKEVAEIGEMVPRTCAHLREPRVQLVHSVNSDHIVDIA